MKYKNKLKALAIISLMSTTAFATDWNKLIEQMPTATLQTLKLETMLDSLSVNYASFKDGKFRFVDISEYNNKTPMVLTIESSQEETIESACTSSARFKNSKFKAQLKLKIPTLNIDNLKSNGQLVAFENPLKIDEPKLVLLSTQNSRFTWINNMRDGEFKQYGDDTGAGVTSFIASAISNRDKEGNVIIDLSKNNGLACDIAVGNIHPTVYRAIESEKGLPLKEASWVTKEGFANLYKSFWADPLHSSKIQTLPTQKEIESNELILIGMKLAQSEADGFQKNVFRKGARALNLLKAIKLNSERVKDLSEEEIGRLDMEDNLKLTTEYSAPGSSDLVVVQKIVITPQLTLRFINE